MSVKQYETYLAETFIEWVSGIIQPGERYQFKSPDPDNALQLWQAFVDWQVTIIWKLRQSSALLVSPVMVFSLFRCCTESQRQHSRKTTYPICAMKLLAAAGCLPKLHC